MAAYVWAWFSWRSLPVKRKFLFSLSLRWEEGSNCGIVWVCLKSKVPFHSNRRGKWAIRVLLYLHSSKYRKHLGVCRFSLRGKAQGQHYVTVTNKPFFAHPHADTVDDIYFVSFPVPLQEWKRRKKNWNRVMGNQTKVRETEIKKEDCRESWHKTNDYQRDRWQGGRESLYHYGQCPKVILLLRNRQN